jgi:NAD(P)-dependent dehydrogenase (short-subunit alcohol dehydrogenase family)
MTVQSSARPDETRVGLVTGGNRGIGFEIVRQLARLGLRVYLTARDPTRGGDACARLRREGLDVDFEVLDVADAASVEGAVARIGERSGRLDVVVNNAGIARDYQERLVDSNLALITPIFETNFFGALRVTRASIPWMSRHAYGRIVNVSSGLGSFAQMASRSPFYRLSKTALNAMTVILADELRDTNILINAVNPGRVRTRLTGMRGIRTTEEGAATAVWLATLADGGPSGKFFKDDQEVPW